MQTTWVVGCGFVGSQLASELVQSGHRVWGIKRSPAVLPNGVEGLFVDLSAPEAVRQLPDGPVDHVVFCAAAKEHTPEAYERTYVTSLEHLITGLGARRDTIKTLVFTSSTGVYGQDDGEWVDENSPTEPQRFSGEILLRAERLITQLSTRGCIVRLSGIYGPGRDRLIRAALAESDSPVSEAPVFSNRIHRDDCAGVVKHVLELTDRRPVYLASDNLPAPVDTVRRFIRSRTSGAAAEPSKQVAGDETIKGAKGKRCSNRLLRESGYHFRYPTFVEGYSAMLQDEA